MRLKKKIFGKDNDNEFVNECLEKHNEYRKKHGVEPLVLNKDLCKLSSKWAEEIAKKDDMSYSSNEEYGESIYCGWCSDPTVKVSGADVVDKWYAQVRDYEFGKEPHVLKSGLFTQIVWKSTKELGVGYAKSKSGKTYVVANYKPAGNFRTQFVENVPPPLSGEVKITSEPPRSVAAPPEILKKSNEVATKLAEKFKSASISDHEFEQDCLDAHNQYRRRHGVPPLTLNMKICRYSEEWAKTLVKKGKMEHRPQNDYGENIFYSWSSNPNHEVNGRDAVDKWYSEVKDYTFSKEPSSLKAGHFSQVVWEDSRELGVGMARSTEGHVFVVANYYPPGNIIGEFADKVKPIKK